jgi:hypothetical protein
MQTETFPSRLDLDQLRRRAKDLAKAARQGEPTALALVADYRRPGAPLSSLARRRSFGRSGCLTRIRRSRRTTSVLPLSSASTGTSARYWRGTHRSP